MSVTIQGHKETRIIISNSRTNSWSCSKALFACDMRLKHDVDCLTDMNLVKDDLADVAYFVKELQDS